MVRAAVLSAPGESLRLACALITGTVGLDRIDGAFADLSAGKGARPVVAP